MKFKLFSKLGSLEGMELILFVIAAAVAALLVFGIVRYTKHPHEKPAGTKTRALVYGALCLTVSFVLSYFKLFSLPFGGSITLVSMLPIMLYAWAYGPIYGFLTALAYALLQIVQGAYIVHPVQFVLDYLVGFLCLGIPSLFPDYLTTGVTAGGLMRMLVSTVSGAIFFADSGLEYGIANPWLYSFIYNALTIGVDTLLCVIVSRIKPVRTLAERMK